MYFFASNQRVFQDHCKRKHNVYLEQDPETGYHFAFQIEQGKFHQIAGSYLFPSTLHISRANREICEASYGINT
jgi:hypothetical protein